MVLWLNLFGIFGVVYRFPAFTQRIFKYDVIQNIHFAPEQELNILVYWTNAFVRHHIQELHTFKNDPVFCPTLYFYLQTGGA